MTNAIHQCKPGAGQEAWHDGILTPATVMQTLDGAWFVGGDEGDFGVHTAYCPFCGVKLAVDTIVNKEGAGR